MLSASLQLLTTFRSLHLICITLCLPLRPIDPQCLIIWLAMIKRLKKYQCASSANYHRPWESGGQLSLCLLTGLIAFFCRQHGSLRLSCPILRPTSTPSMSFLSSVLEGTIPATNYRSIPLILWPPAMTGEWWQTCS